MKNPKKVCSQIGLALLAMLAVWFVIGGVLTGVLMMLPVFQTIGWAAILLNDLTLYALGVPVFLLIMHFIPNSKAQRPVPAPFGVAGFLLVLLAAFGLMYVGNFVSVGLGALVESVSGAELMDVLGDVVGQSNMLTNFIFLVIVPAIGEEFIFRYMIFKKMRGAGDWNYILLSSWCFALFHTNIQQMVYAFLLGLVFGWVYARTEKIWLPMLLHFIINATGIVLMPLLLTVVPEWALYILIGLFILGGAVVLALKLRGAVAGMLPPAEPGWPQKRGGAAVHPETGYPVDGAYQAGAAYKAGQAMPPSPAQAEPSAQLPYGPGDPLPQIPNRSTMPGQYDGPPPEVLNLPVNAPPAAQETVPESAAAALQHVPQATQMPSAQPKGVLFGNVGMVLYIIATGLIAVTIYILPILMKNLTEFANFSM